MSRTPKTDALVAELRRRGVAVLEHDDWRSIRTGVYLARLTSRPHALLPGRPVDTLWNHITVTFDDGELVGDFKADLREIERIGFERFGSGISYNILVDANAPRPRVAIGQYLEAKGTHTVNDKGVPGYSHDQNAVALAIAWIGVPGDDLNEHAVEAMVQVRAALIEIGALTRNYDDVPHSLVAAKDCPTDELRDRLPALKRAALNQEEEMALTEKQAQQLDDVHRWLGPDGVIRIKLNRGADLVRALRERVRKGQAVTLEQLDEVLDAIGADESDAGA